MGTILSLCEKAVVIERGQLGFYGPVGAGVEFYMSTSGVTSTADIDLAEHQNRRPGCPSLLKRVVLRNGEGELTNQFLSGEAIALELSAEADESMGDLHFGVAVEDALGCRLFTVATYLTDTIPATSGRHRCVRCQLNELPLAPGRYYVSLNAGPLRDDVSTDLVDQAASFEVTATDYYGGGKLPHARRGRMLMRSRWDALASVPS
jgi:hypothetical protein